MAVSRRGFLGSVPICSLFRPVAAIPSGSGGNRSTIQFTDVAPDAGLKHKVYYGDEGSWKYILETTGCGIAFFDYDNDGWLDIFVVNGSRLGDSPAVRSPLTGSIATIATAVLRM